jgi:ribosomal protein S18 acetylase RimI-like enzyme
MTLKLREFRMKDYRDVRELWGESGLEIRPGDDENEVRIKVTRDPELFLVAEEDDRVVGSLMGAWDGRRGWLYHLGVLPEYRRRGIAAALVEEVERRMKAKGVVKANTLVYDTNTPSLAFFKKMGYPVDRSMLFLGKRLVTKRSD